MKIALQSIKVSELVAGFEDKSEEGVRGYGGLLDIRPPYQRERGEDVHRYRRSHALG